MRFAFGPEYSYLTGPVITPYFMVPFPVRRKIKEFFGRAAHATDDHPPNAVFNALDNILATVHMANCDSFFHVDFSLRSLRFHNIGDRP